jgi:L-lactate dehydrogenase complex protein LldF
VKIPLPELLRTLREDQLRGGLTPGPQRVALRLWHALATRPRVYHALESIAARLLARIGGRRGVIRHLPGARGWTGMRDLPAPQGVTFLERWRAERGCA